MQAGGTARLQCIEKARLGHIALSSPYKSQLDLVKKMARDDFSKPIKDALARRVGFLCSNPDCKAATSGPHTEPTKSVSVGVAAHITAASAGGPRYNPNITSEERSSIENAIWLCQNCAKLIDSDANAYPLPKIYRWKVTSENAALRSLKGAMSSEYFPQPTGAIHAPLPRIAGLSYDDARELLIGAGWQPFLNHWSKASEWEMTFGNGAYFWRKGFHEIQSACPTGLAYCTFAFRDIYGNLLVVVTHGEACDEHDSAPCVCNWRFERDGNERTIV